MKLITATTQTQGQRSGDFNWCIDGELVSHATMICDRDLEFGPEDGCGCGRSFTGLNSGKGTTTAIVIDLDGFTLADLIEAVHSSREQAGWTTGQADRERKHSETIAAVHAELAGSYPVGTILERRLDVVQARDLAS